MAKVGSLQLDNWQDLDPYFPLIYFFLLDQSKVIYQRSRLPGSALTVSTVLVGGVVWCGPTNFLETPIVLG